MKIPNSATKQIIDYNISFIGIRLLIWRTHSYMGQILITSSFCSFVPPRTVASLTSDPYY